MSLFLSKLLPVFVYPLGFALVLGFLAFAFSFTRFRRLGRSALLAALAILWIASTPLFAGWLTSGLEAKYPPVPIDGLPNSDAAIVLGGAIGQPLPPRLAADLGFAADRVLHTARIFRAGKARYVVVAAGNLPWQPARDSEAALIRDLLIEFGVPAEAILLDTGSRNTYENAVNTGSIFREHGWTSGVLVTSGAHMPRALAVFRRAGLDLLPASTDIQATYPLYTNPLDLLPDAYALAETSTAIKEWIGLFVYRFRGWA